MRDGQVKQNANADGPAMVPKPQRHEYAEVKIGAAHTPNDARADSPSITLLQNTGVLECVVQDRLLDRGENEADV